APATPTMSSPYENCRNRSPVQVKFSSACDFRRFILATCTSCAGASVVSRRYQPVPAQCVQALKTFQKSLPDYHCVQPSCPAQAITDGDMTPLNGFGRLSLGPVQPRKDVTSVGSGAGHCFNIRKNTSCSLLMR